MAGLLAVAGILLATSAPAALFGTTGAGGTPSVLVELDPATGALIRTVGPVGYTVNGLASGRDGTLYAVTRGDDPGCARGLLRIDMTTGAGTPIGCSTPITSGNRPVLLTANASGQLYGWFDPSADDLITWDKVAGTFSAPIGDAGIGTGGHTLAFDVPGTTLYLLQASSLYTINTTTGVASSVGSVTGTTGHHGDFNPDNGRLYVVDGTEDPAPNIAVIDIGTRTQVALLPTVPYLHTLAFFGPPSPPPVAQEVPVDNPWALAAIALLLAAFGAVYMRRQA
jgi:hypothetical protein